MQLLHSAIIDIKLTNSNNGRGYSWHGKAKDRDAIERVLRCDGHVREPFSQLVVVHLTRILGPREQFWDSDSGLRGNSKELIDALVACGWFHDDGYKWIKETRFFQDSSQRKIGPCAKIEIFDCL